MAASVPQTLNPPASSVTRPLTESATRETMMKSFTRSPLRTLESNAHCLFSGCRLSRMNRIDPSPSKRNRA
jgi:hypothetical protein